METKKIDTLFEKNGISDKKHKLNTCPNNIIKDEILKEIENNGVTLERLNELQKNGIDIFKYQTQITIHGIFSELQQNYLFSYKSLFQNKNKSIGIKWNAVDGVKKQKIGGYLEYFNFNTVKNSNYYCFSNTKKCTTKDVFSEIVNEFKTIYNRIDGELFFGNCDIFTYNYMGLVFIELRLIINAIPEENIDLLVEQITGKKMADVNDFIKKKDEEKKNRRAELEIKWEQERREEKQREEEFLKNNVIKEAETVIKYQLQEGDIIIHTIENYSTNEFYYEFQIVEKQKRTLYLCKYDYKNKEKGLSYGFGKKHCGIYTGMIIKTNK